MRVGKNLEPTTKQALVKFLQENQEVFAWSHKDMVGIDPAVISHVLNINKAFPPAQQKEGCSIKTDQKP